MASKLLIEPYKLSGGFVWIYAPEFSAEGSDHLSIKVSNEFLAAHAGVAPNIFNEKAHYEASARNRRLIIDDLARAKIASGQIERDPVTKKVTVTITEADL